jgi:hypothetical protein
LALTLLGNVVASCSLMVDPDALSSGCASGTKFCNGECVSTSSPENGCGRSSCQPCALPHAASVCSPSGECVVGACAGSYENCNNVQSDGCELDVDTDTDHCGGCNAPPCELPNAEPDCASGRCAILRCRTGFGNCDRDSDNGCEVNVTNDPDHCGTCEIGCADGQSCVSGSCG